MPQLIVQSLTGSSVKETAYALTKPMTSVGPSQDFDICVSAEMPGMVFSLIQKENGAVELLPGSSKTRINGQAIPQKTVLLSCDRIEWNGGLALYLESSTETQRTETTRDKVGGNPLSILSGLADAIQQPGGVLLALQHALRALVESANAEVGYLVSETKPTGNWEVLASHSPDGLASRKTLFSNSMLQEAIRTRAPVYIGNIIGHPWAQNESVLEARIFSATCLPLIVAERVFGAVFLATRSPGKSIQKEVLVDLSIVATHAALLLASQIELTQTRKENTRLKQSKTQLSGALLKWNSAVAQNPMHDVMGKVAKVADSPLSVLILGETGSGKDVLAREVHRLSARSVAPFVAINCAAIPATLMESILFGYERGAFTGADKSTPGKLEEAHGGTLFLDEIGELSLELQAKLLRVLQDRQVERVGGRIPKAVDMRIVCATNQNLEDIVRSGRFRQDLYYRIAGVVLKLPPLRERIVDLDVLVPCILEKIGRQIDVSSEAWSALRAHSWPGNVRELEHTLNRAAFLAEGTAIEPRDLELQTAAFAKGDSAQLEWMWKSIEERGINLKDAQEIFTKEYVQWNLNQWRGSKAELAQHLGVSERTLYRILG